MTDDTKAELREAISIIAELSEAVDQATVELVSIAEMIAGSAGRRRVQEIIDGAGPNSAQGRARAFLARHAEATDGQ